MSSVRESGREKQVLLKTVNFLSVQSQEWQCEILHNAAVKHFSEGASELHALDSHWWLSAYTIGLIVVAVLPIAYFVNCLFCVSLCNMYVSSNPSDTQ